MEQVIVAVPPETPVTSPEASTVATPVALELQETEGVTSARVEVVPAQNASVPVMAAGEPLTVTTVEVEPQDVVYTMVTVSAATPVMMPVVEPAVAVPGVTLVQVPPPVASANVVVPPIQTVAVPVIEAGVPLTVTVTVVLLHPAE